MALLVLGSVSAVAAGKLLTSFPATSSTSNTLRVVPGSPSVLVHGSQSTFNITFVEPYDVRAKEAFAFAALQWANVFRSSAPVRVVTRYAALAAVSSATNSDLGSTFAYLVFGNGTNGLLNRTWYNTALAGAIAGPQVVAGTPFDMQIDLNSAAPWHFDPYTTIDPLSEPHAIDLATTVMRQIAAGLGFSGTITANPQTKTAHYGLSYDTHYGYPAFSIPGRFDSLLTDAAGCSLIESCRPFGGGGLYQALTTLNNVLIRDRAGNPFMLFSPNPYNAGTNTYQFSPTTWLWDCVAAGFQTQRCSSLVTPYAVPGEQNYEIGANTLAVLELLMSNDTLPSPLPSYCTTACSSNAVIVTEAIAAFQDDAPGVNAGRVASLDTPAVDQERAHLGSPTERISIGHMDAFSTSLLNVPDADVPAWMHLVPSSAPSRGAVSGNQEAGASSLEKGKNVYVPLVPEPLPSTSGLPNALLPSCGKVRKALASALQNVLQAYNYSNSAVAPMHCHLNETTERYLLSAAILGLDLSALGSVRATLLDSANTTGVLIAVSMQVALGTSLSLDPVVVVRLYDRTGELAPVMPPPLPLQTALSYAGAYDVHWRVEAAPGTVVNQTAFCAHTSFQSLLQSATLVVLEFSISKALNTSRFGTAQLSLVPGRSECSLYRASPDSAPPAKYDLFFTIGVARSAANLNRSAAFAAAGATAAQMLSTVDVQEVLQALAPHGLFTNTVFVQTVYSSFAF